MACGNGVLILSAPGLEWSAVAQTSGLGKAAGGPAVQSAQGD